MYQSLTTTWAQEINRDIITARVDPAIFMDLFSQDSPDDRVVVGGEPGPAGGRPGALFGFRTRALEITDQFAVLRPPTI